MITSQFIADSVGNPLQIPIVSVVTVTFNASDLLRLTASSIQSQKSPVEWVIVDGGSNDDTVEIIQQVCKPSLWLSEPDKGIYDAFNKGCSLANGKWVIFLGAGDCFFDDQVICDFIARLETINENVKIIYGDVAITNSENRTVEVLSASELIKKGSWESGRPAMPHHQGVFHHCSILESAPFDIKYRIAADGKLIIPYLTNEHSAHINRIIAKSNLGGVSTEPRTALKTAIEIRKINVELGLAWIRLPTQILFFLKCAVKSWLARWLSDYFLKFIIDRYRIATRRGAKWKT